MTFEPTTVPVPHWKVVLPDADVPPIAFSVTPPDGLQTDRALDIEVGAVDKEFIDTLYVGPEVADEQGAASSRRTQYVVFVVGLTVMVAVVSPAIMLLPKLPVPHW